MVRGAWLSRPRQTEPSSGRCITPMTSFRVGPGRAVVYACRRSAGILTVLLCSATQRILRFRCTFLPATQDLGPDGATLAQARALPYTGRTSVVQAWRVL